MKGITSVNLAVMPFVSSCDSTRANMSSKQFSQSLTHLNCDVPYVISNEWRSLSYSSSLGIYHADDDGEIIYNKNDLLIIHYPKYNRIEVEKISPTIKTTSIYASSLRNSLPTGFKFNKDDILYEYDCFRNGIPSSGYNCNTMYSPFFGFNHEDALIISESFAERAKHKYTETVYVPIYEYTLLQKIYTNHLGYFPEIGEKILDDVVCLALIPQNTQEKKNFDTRSIKSQVLTTLQNMNLSDLINMRINGQTSGFMTEKIKSGVINGTLTGFKIHKIKKNIKLIDNELQQKIDNIYSKYNLFILDVYSDLSKLVSEQFAKKIIRQHFLYGDRDKIRRNLNLMDAVYLIEFEITKENQTSIGDKLSTRHASKGVVSLILPDELRPICQQSKKPVDFIYNPFGVFSRMNLSQLLEVTCAKSTEYTNELIKHDPKNICLHLHNLNESVIKFLGDTAYYHKIQMLIEMMKSNTKLQNDFLEDVWKNNLYIEVPSFAKIQLRNLLQLAHPQVNENVVISRNLIKYMKQKLNCFENLIVNNDVVLPNVFVGPIYVQKLYKIANKLIAYRDFGPLKFVTKQPVRGRAASGGSVFGQMELESVMASGCDKAVRELLTVKNDWNVEKKNMLQNLINNGVYHLPKDIPEDSSRTKTVINTILKFLKK